MLLFIEPLKRIARVQSQLRTSQEGQQKHEAALNCRDVFACKVNKLIKYYGYILYKNY